MLRRTTADIRSFSERKFRRTDSSESPGFGSDFGRESSSSEASDSDDNDNEAGTDDDSCASVASRRASFAVSLQASHSMPDLQRVPAQRLMASSLVLPRRHAKASDGQLEAAVDIEVLRNATRRFAQLVLEPDQLRALVYHWSKSFDAGHTFADGGVQQSPPTMAVILESMLRILSEARYELRLTSQHELRLFEDNSDFRSAAFSVPTNLLSAEAKVCVAMLLSNSKHVFTKVWPSGEVGVGKPYYRDFVFNSLLEDTLSRHTMIRVYVEELMRKSHAASLWRTIVAPELEGIVGTLITRAYTRAQLLQPIQPNGQRRYVSEQDLLERSRLTRVSSALDALQSYLRHTIEQQDDELSAALARI